MPGVCRSSSTSCRWTFRLMMSANCRLKRMDVCSWRMGRQESSSSTPKMMSVIITSTIRCQNCAYASTRARAPVCSTASDWRTAEIFWMVIALPSESPSTAESERAVVVCSRVIVCFATSSRRVTTVTVTSVTSTFLAPIRSSSRPPKRWCTPPILEASPLATPHASPSLRSENLAASVTSAACTPLRCFASASTIACSRTAPRSPTSDIVNVAS
mmetsp:Transcript_12945/g.33172  ORF Transcript_12945/g.33172 Transcript_12945/m.33172 type:complete len:215 (+) Transcript_12945:374-1018(+)